MQFHLTDVLVESDFITLSDDENPPFDMLLLCRVVS